MPVDDDAPDDYFAKDHFVGFPTDGYSALVAEIPGTCGSSIDLETPFEHGVEAGYDLCFNPDVDRCLRLSARLAALPVDQVSRGPPPRVSVFLFPVVNFTDDGPSPG